VGVQIRLEKGDTERPADYTVFYEEGNENRQLGTDFFARKTIISAVRRVEIVSDKMSHIILKGGWRNTAVLKVHAPSEDTSDNVKGSSYRKLGHVPDQ
jgi:hypothetical protein